jgi:hypothetical protein
MKICEMCSKSHDGSYGSGRFCSSFCARKFSTKEDREEINNKLREAANHYFSLHPAVKKQTISKTCPICKNDFFTWKSVNRIYCSKKCYLLDAKCEFRRHSKGGYRKNSGRGKCGYYKGIWCQSTYELAYVIYNIDHNIKFERNTEKFKYINHESKEKEYIPDFIVNDGFVEVKGYHTEDVDLKAKSVNKPIVILYKKNLKYAFDYIALKYKKYGINIRQLYDEHKPLFKYHCCNCNKCFSSDVKRKTKLVYCSRKCAGVYRATEKHKV